MNIVIWRKFWKYTENAWVFFFPQNLDFENKHGIKWTHQSFYSPIVTFSECTQSPNMLINKNSYKGREGVSYVVPGTFYRILKYLFFAKKCLEVGP